MAFRSGLEEKVADLLVELGVKYEYESTKVPYVIQHNYTPDFILPNGVWLECKGYWDSKDRKKIKEVMGLVLKYPSYKQGYTQIIGQLS